MPKIDKCRFSGTAVTMVSSVKERCIFRRLWKTDSDGAEVTCCGRLLRTRKTRSPIESRVRQTICDGGRGGA